MRLLNKTLESIPYYPQIGGKESDGTEIETYSDLAKNFTGKVIQTAGGIKAELYGERITNMITIITSDSEYPSKKDKVIHKGVAYKVIVIMYFSAHAVLDLEAI